MYTFSTMDFPTTLSHKFWCTLFTLSFSSVYFWISFETFSWLLCCLEVFCLVSKVWEIDYFQRLHPVSVLLKLLTCVLWPRIWSVLVCVLWVLEKSGYSAVTVRSVLWMSDLVGWWHFEFFCILAYFLSTCSITCWDRGVESLTITVNLSVSLFHSITWSPLAPCRGSLLLLWLPTLPFLTASLNEGGVRAPHYSLEGWESWLLTRPLMRQWWVGLQFFLRCLAGVEWLLCKFSFSVLVDCSFPSPLARDRELFGLLLISFHWLFQVAGFPSIQYGICESK